MGHSLYRLSVAIHEFASQARRVEIMLIRIWLFAIALMVVTPVGAEPVKGPAPTGAKVGVVYCSTQQATASCSLYYYNTVEGTPMRSVAPVSPEGGIDVVTSGRTTITAKPYSARTGSPAATTYAVATVGDATVGPAYWANVGEGMSCKTPTKTCQLKSKAVLDTGCSCKAENGRVRGVVAP